MGVPRIGCPSTILTALLTRTQLPSAARSFGVRAMSSCKRSPVTSIRRMLYPIRFSGSFASKV